MHLLQDQLFFLRARDPELHDLILAIQNEELTHLNHAEEHITTKSLWSRWLGNSISWATDAAIWLSTWGDSARMKRELAADAAFRAMIKGRYRLALAAYHDQGMIPLKLYSPESLVNITLGLPFIRTSPGHGTAYDIAGKGKADARPMIESILLAAEYAKA